MSRKPRPGEIGGPAKAPPPSALQNALALMQRGDLAAADQLLAQMRSAFPGDARLENLLGGLRLRQGRPEEALECFQRAVRASPRDPYAALNKGKVELGLGLIEKATASLGKALKLDPGLAEGHTLLGDVLARRGKAAEAKKSYQKALALNGGLPLARQGLGLLYLAEGDGARAAGQFRALLEMTPVSEAAARSISLANLGLAYELTGEKALALPCLLAACGLAPENAAFRRALVRNLRFAKDFPEEPAAEARLLALLGSRDVNPRSLSTAVQACLRRKYRLDDALANQDRDPEADGAAELDALLAPMLRDPLFLAYLRACPVTDVEFEVALTRLRRDMLLAFAEGRERSEPGMDLVAALAEQAWLNEYVFFVTAAEEAALDRLLTRPTTEGEPANAGWLRQLLACCYRPLTELPFDLEPLDRPEPVEALFRQQVLEARREREIAAEIPSFGDSDDAVSQSVERQYSENPYPRWTRCDLAEPAPLHAAVRRELPHLAAGEIPKIEGPRILIAGCGTGLQTMRVVSTYAGASILAVDISRPSIAYGVRKLEEYGVQNVEHRRANILDLGALTERFDLIESYGVIHHMEDPAAALRVLSGLLKSKGLIYLGLYSQIGRRSVVRAREIASEQGFAGDPGGIREARRALMRMEDEAVAPLLSPASDFWTASDTRDLILHVQEHRLSLPEIGAMLRSCGLDFLGLGMRPADRNLFRSEAPEKSAPRSIDALHAFEQRHPEVFGDTYKIWARKR